MGDELGRVRLTINPRGAKGTWLGHRSEKSTAAMYDKLSDADSQSFVAKVPFGTGAPAADAGEEDV
jgi:hypothetical protein